MAEPTTGPASCAYQHSAREEASGRFGDATCKVEDSEPCRETRGRSAPKPRRCRSGPTDPWWLGLVDEVKDGGAFGCE